MFLCVFERAPFLYNFWLNFGHQFGVILGAKFATILLFGRPGGQNELAKEVRKPEQKETPPKVTQGTPPPPPTPAEPPRRTP